MMTPEQRKREEELWQNVRRADRLIIAGGLLIVVAIGAGIWYFVS
jgi:hypothetical protein